MSEFHKKFTTHNVKSNGVSRVYASKAAAKKAETLLKEFGYEVEVEAQTKTIDLITGKEVPAKSAK